MSMSQRAASPAGSTRSSRPASLLEGGPMDIFYGSRIDRGRELQNSSESSLPRRAGTINERVPAGSLGRAFSRLRPSLLSRSVSSPHVVPGRKRASTTIPSFANNPLPTPPEHWTLFGQLMENEGQLRSPGPSHRRPSRTRTRLNDGQGSLRTDASIRSRTPSVGPRNITTNIGPAAADDRDPFYVQSPVIEEPTSGAVMPAHLHDGEESTTEYGSDSDSDSSDTQHAMPEKSRWSSLTWFSLSEVPVLYRNIIKSAIAYFIASLFTYAPYLSSWISDLVSYGRGDSHNPLPSGHMVATVAVYFHPAKTMGAMFEADLFFIFGIFYSALVSVASMSVYWWLELKPGWEWLGDVVVISLVGLGMSFLAWMKVWMASPQFNTACSMVAIIVFIVVANEGGVLELLQVSFIVFCGSFISNLVCFLIWPQSATSNLQTNMTKTLDSFSTLLNLLTNIFLLEEGLHHPKLEKLHRAVENHQNSFTSLKKNLSESKSEWHFWVRANSAPNPNGSDSGLATGYNRTKAYEDAVDSLNRLAQHLNGLRGGTRLQYELTKAGMVRTKRSEGGKNKAAETPEVNDEDKAMLESAAAMFGDLVDDMGPPMKALSSTCTVSLKRLREAFELAQTQGKRKKKDGIQLHEFTELIDGIERALLRFESTSNHAVLRLYRRSNIPSMVDSMTSDYFTDDNQITASENEHVFLVYFFIFTLQEFARELVSLIDAMERIYVIERQRTGWRSWWRGFFAALGNSFTGLFRRKPADGSHGGIKKKTTGLQRKISNYIKPRSDKRRPFPKVKPHAPNTIQTPAWKDLTFIGKIKQSLWTIGTRFRERDTKYALKTGMAAAILAAPSFFDSTRPIFVKYYGQWALISFFVVMSPTIGATNNLSLHRILGTLFGAGVAAGIYTLFPEDAIILSAFGFFFSLPCFYYIISKPAYMSAGRFVLLTYNLTCLYCYNIRDKDIAVVDVAINRAIAVAGGVIWAAFISRFWWPTEARRELSVALSEFCLNMGWLYTRLVASNSFASEYQQQGDVRISINERTSLLSPVNTGLNNSIQEFMAMELHLQIKLIELQGLLAQTQHEPRLKGPFPVALYRGILTSLQTMLDKLHSMRCVTTREEWYTSVRTDFIIPVNKERHEMVGNIILYLSTLSSAFRLKAPLPPYLPPAEKSRQRLVDAIRKLDVVRNRDVKGSRQLLFFAYALTMKGVTAELEWLGRTLQDAFGVIGQTPEEFEALFMDAEESGRRQAYAI